MKKLLLPTCFLLASFSAAYAQPSLTAATNNPVPGDVFYGTQCDTTGVTPGSSGASVTWNLSALTATGFDTTSYYTCSTAIHCDSFAGSNIVAYDGSGYTYMQASTAGFSLLGYYSMGSYYHIIGGHDIIYYPLTYTSTHLDTSGADYGGFAFQYVQDSFIYDGYGTLILPTGTYTNVVRVHDIEITKDSSFTGSSWDVTFSRTENYSWYQSGFHNQLLTMSIDTASGNTVEYYKQGPPLEVSTPAINNLTLDVYPNPAAGMINVTFNLPDNGNAAITVTDMVGRLMNITGADKIKTGQNHLQIPVADLPNGTYILRLQGAGESISKRIVVKK